MGSRMTVRKITFTLISFVVLAGAAWSYSSGARDSLLKSRDQVADQRAQLQSAYSDIDRKIDELQKQKFNIGQYLQDCDRTLRDIDKALSAQDAAYRDMR